MRNIKLLLISVCSTILFVCSELSCALDIDEYVNRIAKKILIVSDHPEIIYNFKVIPSDTPGLAFDQETNSILVSSNLLQRLQDEAELAAVLSLGVAKYSQNADPDRATVDSLYRAGYDPQALVDLQEQYFLSTPEDKNFWFSNLYPYQLTPEAITYSKSLMSGLPQGLLRGTEEYTKNCR